MLGGKMRQEELNIGIPRAGKNGLMLSLMIGLLERIPARISSLVPFAGINLIRFNGSRMNGLSLMALRQVNSVYKIGLVKPSDLCDFDTNLEN